MNGRKEWEYPHITCIPNKQKQMAIGIHFKLTKQIYDTFGQQICFFFCPVLLVSQQQLYVATTHKPISQRYDALRRYVCQRQHQIAAITGRQTVVASKSSGSNRTPINVTNVREQLWSCCCVLALVVSIYVGTCMAGWLTHVQKWSNISWCSPLIIHTWVSVHRVATLFAAFID